MKKRAFFSCGPSAGVHGASPLCEPPDSLCENIKVHSLYLCWVGDRAVYQEPGRWPLKHRCGAVTGTAVRLLGASKDAETEEKRGPFLYGIRAVSSWRRF